MPKSKAKPSLRTLLISALGKNSNSSNNGWISRFACTSPRTDSFRGAKELPKPTSSASTKSSDESVLFKSFNSLYILSDLNSSRLDSNCKFEEIAEDDEEEFGRSSRGSSSVIFCDEKGTIFEGPQEEEDDMSYERDLFTCTSKSASDFSSSESDRGSEFIAGLFRGITSQRFFFDPGKSNSIMDDANKNPKSRFFQEASTSDYSHEQQSYEEERVCNEEAAENGIVLSGSKACKLYSRNPYIDFRISMQEMVLAHGIEDWCDLQKLLVCYLGLNNHRTHSVILCAFTDLVIELFGSCESSSLLDYRSSNR